MNRKHTGFPTGTRVRVAGCYGKATVEKYLQKYKVYLLDQPITDKNGFSYWTWPKSMLIRIEQKLIRKF